MYIVIFFFCFFKHKTAYDMRMSDWSSDVCSSDLIPRLDISKCIDLPGSPGNQTDTRILPLAAAVRPCKAQCSLVTEHKAAGLNLQRVGKRRYCPYVRGPVVICRPHAGWATLIRRRCPETIAPVPASRERQETVIQVRCNCGR